MFWAGTRFISQMAPTTSAQFPVLAHEKNDLSFEVIRLVSATSVVGWAKETAIKREIF